MKYCASVTAQGPGESGLPTLVRLSDLGSGDEHVALLLDPGRNAERATHGEGERGLHPQGATCPHRCGSPKARSCRKGRHVPTDAAPPRPGVAADNLPVRLWSR
jgi:hypothetical protein